MLKSLWQWHQRIQSQQLHYLCVLAPLTLTKPSEVRRIILSFYQMKKWWIELSRVTQIGRTHTLALELDSLDLVDKREKVGEGRQEFLLSDKGYLWTFVYENRIRKKSFCWFCQVWAFSDSWKCVCLGVCLHVCGLAGVHHLLEELHSHLVFPHSRVLAKRPLQKIVLLHSQSTDGLNYQGYSKHLEDFCWLCLLPLMPERGGILSCVSWKMVLSTIKTGILRAQTLPGRVISGQHCLETWCLSRKLKAVTASGIHIAACPATLLGRRRYCLSPLPPGLMQESSLLMITPNILLCASTSSVPDYSIPLSLVPCFFCSCSD